MREGVVRFEVDSFLGGEERDKGAYRFFLLMFFLPKPLTHQPIT